MVKCRTLLPSEHQLTEEFQIARQQPVLPRTCLNVYVIPALGNAWIGDLDLPDLNETVRGLMLRDGTPASASTKGTVASVIRRLFAWARQERLIVVNPALELRTGWGGSTRRRVVIPSIPQVPSSGRSARPLQAGSW